MAELLELAPGRVIGHGKPCFIIAEVGQNHQGNIDIAKQLIKIAKECGADCVKFQKSSLEHKFNQAALERPYVGHHSWGKTYGEHKRHLEFSEEEFKELQHFAREVGIFFTASAMDMKSADFLHSLDVPFIKVGSGDTNNFCLLEHVAKLNRQLVVSTGMQDMATVQEVYSLLQRHKCRFCLLQCTSAYPTPPSEVNLNVIHTYREAFPDIHIGYSGHENGIVLSVAAVAIGAKVLERHITMDKTWKGSDHCCSLEPHEFSELVKQVRIMEEAMGSPTKRMQPSEQACHLKLGKSVVAARSLPVGTILREDDLEVKVAEPRGWPAQKIQELVGKKVKKPINWDQSVTEVNLE